MPIKTTLVVDDSKSARIMLSRMLQKFGLKVDMLESGEAAIEYMDSKPSPDVIFMDHMMPGMDGVQACREISAKHQCPIFMYTSKEGPEYESEANAAGAAGMLGKPAQMERLEQVINELNAAQNIPVVSDIAASAQAESSTAPPDDVPTLTPESSEPIKQETPAMTREFVENIATPMIEEQFSTLVVPINQTVQELKTALAEHQSEVRKLVSRQANTTNMVTQPVLDASIKQTSTQLQSQLTQEMKTLRELIERNSELSPSDLEKIKELAIKSGAIAGAEQGEKSATSAAEAVAAKVSAAQAQIQVQQDIAPLLNKLKLASTISVISLLVAITAVGAAFVL